MGQASVYKEVAHNVSLGADYTSPTIDFTQARSIYICVTVTGASGLSGTLSVEANANPLNVNDWQQLGSLAASITTNGVQAFDIPTTGAPYLRVKWVRSGGTGTASVKFSEKLEL